MNYRQCRLSRKQGESTVQQTSWIPSKFAIQGEFVKLKDGDGNWTDGWHVDSVSSESVSEEFVTQARHAHTRQRNASDI